MPRIIDDKLEQIIAYNLIRIRKQRKLTQGEVGEILDITSQQVNKYENAKNRISASKLYKLAKYYQVYLESFFKEIP